MNWETIEQSPIEILQRTKDPGGWLVKIRDRVGTSICFYPDPNHEWKSEFEKKVI